MRGPRWHHPVRRQRLPPSARAGPTADPTSFVSGEGAETRVPFRGSDLEASTEERRPCRHAGADGCMQGGRPVGAVTLGRAPTTLLAGRSLPLTVSVSARCRSPTDVRRCPRADTQISTRRRHGDHYGGGVVMNARSATSALQWAGAHSAAPPSDLRVATARRSGYRGRRRRCSRLSGARAVPSTRKHPREALTSCPACRTAGCSARRSAACARRSSRRSSPDSRPRPDRPVRERARLIVLPPCGLHHTVTVWSARTATST